MTHVGEMILDDVQSAVPAIQAASARLAETARFSLGPAVQPSAGLAVDDLDEFLMVGNAISEVTITQGHEINPTLDTSQAFGTFKTYVTSSTADSLEDPKGSSVSPLAIYEARLVLPGGGIVGIRNDMVHVFDVLPRAHIKRTAAKPLSEARYTLELSTSAEFPAAVAKHKAARRKEGKPPAKKASAPRKKATAPAARAAAAAPAASLSAAPVAPPAPSADDATSASERRKAPASLHSKAEIEDSDAEAASDSASSQPPKKRARRIGPKPPPRIEDSSEEEEEETVKVVEPVDQAAA